MLIAKAQPPFGPCWALDDFRMIYNEASIRCRRLRRMSAEPTTAKAARDGRAAARDPSTNDLFNPGTSHSAGQPCWDVTAHLRVVLVRDLLVGAGERLADQLVSPVVGQAAGMQLRQCRASPGRRLGACPDTRNGQPRTHCRCQPQRQHCRLSIASVAVCSCVCPAQ